MLRLRRPLLLLRLLHTVQTHKCGPGHSPVLGQREREHGGQTGGCHAYYQRVYNDKAQYNWPRLAWDATQGARGQRSVSVIVKKPSLRSLDSSQRGFLTQRYLNKDQVRSNIPTHTNTYQNAYKLHIYGQRTPRA